MELVLLSGPGVEMTPTATDARAWAVADSFPPAPRSGGVTGSDCALCRTLNGYATMGELVVGVTLLVLLGGAVYLFGEVD